MWADDDDVDAELLWTVVVLGRYWAAERGTLASRIAEEELRETRPEDFVIARRILSRPWRLISEILGSCKEYRSVERRARTVRSAKV